MDGSEGRVDGSDAGAGAVECDVLVVGGGVAGLTAATYLARADLDTLVVNEGESILTRNAHLENVPGFPAGVNARTFVDLLTAQAERNGAVLAEGRVVELRREAPEADAKEDVGDGGNTTDAADAHAFVATVADGDTVSARRVVAASWADASYLDGLDVDTRDAGSKVYVGTDATGRTDVPGLYAAGRLAEQYHQAVVAAGHGAQAAVSLLHDAGPFYHDWVAPAGYFTDRGRDVPPGCEEIDEAERRRRERESMAVMRSYFEEPHPGRQRTHPSLVDDELGRLPDGSSASPTARDDDST